MKAADIERIHGGKEGKICYVSGKTVKEMGKAACGIVPSTDSEGYEILDTEIYAVTMAKIIRVE